jgi:predicted kinase
MCKGQQSTLSGLSPPLGGRGKFARFLRKISAMLIIFGGLPGSGKSTIAQLLVQKRPATYLRIDAIEHAIITSHGQEDVGPTGYMVAHELAKSNLALGMPVVADSVNPLEITRLAWREVARSMTSLFIEVEVVCSDATEHQRRVSTRKPDIAGFNLPSWETVVSRRYEPWKSSQLVIDTALTTADVAAELILERWTSLSTSI